MDRWIDGWWLDGLTRSRVRTDLSLGLMRSPAAQKTAPGLLGDIEQLWPSVSGTASPNRLREKKNPLPPSAPSSLEVRGGSQRYFYQHPQPMVPFEFVIYTGCKYTGPEPGQKGGRSERRTKNFCHLHT